MTKRMKKKLVAICISCAVVFTGPGMSMVTRAYADEITQDQQQDGNSANAQVSPGEDENNQADNTENSDDKLNDQNGQNQEDVVQDPTEEQAPEEETDQDAEEAQDEAEPQAEETVNGRTVVNINQGWNFTTNDSTTDGWGFPTGEGSGVVDLPHSWEYVHPTMSFIPQMNAKTVTYTKTVDVSDMNTKNLFLKFYGSARNTEVWIDGERVGKHIGGYSAFVFDITDYVKDKTSFTIKANVTNMDTTSIPINVDYTQWGGIYRDVELIGTEDAYIATEDYGSTGIRVDSTVNGNSATVNLKTELSNKAAEQKDLQLVTEIKDASGNVVNSKEDAVSLEAETTAQAFEDSYTIDSVHLWNGTEDPYLYTMHVMLKDEAGNIVDEASQRFGVRTFEIKNGKFYLNGKEYEIHGVGMHQDREGYGNAVPDELKAQDMDTMQEMGVNAIRTSHYPHDQ